MLGASLAECLLSHQCCVEACTLPSKDKLRLRVRDPKVGLKIQKKKTKFKQVYLSLNSHSRKTNNQTFWAFPNLNISPSGALRGACRGGIKRPAPFVLAMRCSVVATVKRSF